MEVASSKSVKVLTLLLTVLAMGLAGVLVYKSQTLEALPGCGGGSGCETVLTSRWSLWFGIPVSLPAMGIYVAMFAAVLLRDTEAKRSQVAAEWVMMFCGVAVIASALWFIVVQFAIVGAFCIYCMSTHVSAAAAAVLCLLAARPMRRAKASALASGIAVALVALLIAGQVLDDESEAAAPNVRFVEDAPTDTVIDLPPMEMSIPRDSILADPLAGGPFEIQPDLVLQPADSMPDTSPPPTTDNIASTGPRKLDFYGKRFKVDTTTAPIVGDPYAPTVLVVVYDYTCSHCRATRVTLEKTKKKHGNGLAILCLPAPLDKKCNKLIRRTNPSSRYACDLAEVSMAVWRAAPDKWAEFDKMLYTNTDLHTPAKAKIAAWNLIGGEKVLNRGLGDPWVGQRIQLNVRIYNVSSRAAGSGLLPMLITENGIMSGAPRHPLDIDDLLEGKRVKSGTHKH